MLTTMELRTGLKEEVSNLRDRMLGRWVPVDPAHSPGDYQYDVKAYCVLAHAAFEEFAEELSMIAMRSAKARSLKGEYNKSVLALLCSYKFALVTEENESLDQERLFDQVRKGVDEVCQKHSSTIQNNHGFSAKYLRALLTPVGVDLPEAVKLLESLRELAEARGSYAHTQAKMAHFGKTRKAVRPMAPEQAEVAVNDCLELCMLIADRVDMILVPPPTVKQDSAARVGE